MRRTTVAEELKFHIQEAQYNLSRTFYSCVKLKGALLRYEVVLEK